MFGTFGGNSNPFGINLGFGDVPLRFDEHYRVYPVSFCDKGHLEDGDKILLPPSALDTLARLHIEYPMLFKLTNLGANRHSHCGVLEFSAAEGTCYMPYWMMQNLFVNEGDIINIQNISLPKATFVKIRPQSQDFLDISNPRAVLEASLRKFSCMTVGDTICLKYNNKNFLLDVREVRPPPAACIIETDCEVDFEPPADYVEPTPTSANTAATSSETSNGSSDTTSPPSVPYGGVATVKSEQVAAATASSNGNRLGVAGGLRLKKGNEQADTDPAAMRAARLKKYEAFHGTGRSLSGLRSTFSSNSLSTATINSSGGEMAGTASGSGSRRSSATSSVSATQPEEKKFTAFQGAGRRLR